MMLFNLPEMNGNGRRKGNVDPYDGAWKTGGKRNIRGSAWINALSIDKHEGRLVCRMAQGDGLGNASPVREKSVRNCVTNRTTNGRLGMGIAVEFEDKWTGTIAVCQMRIVRSKQELNDRTFTSQSNRLGEDGLGVLREHFAMALWVDSAGRPLRYGLAFIRDLDEAGLVERYEKRNTYYRVRLSGLALSSFYGGRIGGLGFSVGIGADIIEGRDAVEGSIELLGRFREMICESER